MNIYLIGMPGSGKTTVARKFAEKYNYKFVDIDALVEENALMFIDELIDKYGMEKFRELETEALMKISGENLIISCGGGIVENKKNKDYMNGKIIFLDVDNKKIEERLKHDYQRPILIDYSLEELYKKRFLMYQHFADLIISNNNDVLETIKKIKESISL